MKAKSAFRIATTVLRFKVRRLKLLNAHYFLTSRCNLKCSFCMRPLRSPELSTQEALKVVDGVCRLAIPFFHFSGGEPLLRKDLTLLAKRAADNGCIVGLSTNGTLFNQGKPAKLRESLTRSIFLSIALQKFMMNTEEGELSKKLLKP